MNWEEVSAIGQMLGAVAVFVTLGYLAVQLRHSRTALLSSITLTRAAMLRDHAMTTATNEGIAGLLVKAQTAISGRNRPFVEEMVGRAGLTVEEANRVFWFFLGFWQIRSESLRHLKELPDSERKDFDTRMRVQYSAGSLERVWYESNRDILGADAVRYIDNLLARPG